MVQRKPKDHEKLTMPVLRAFISEGATVERNLNDYGSTRAGPAPGTISKDGILKMNETASSESLNDHGNVPRTGARANISSGGIVERKPKDHEKLTVSVFRAFISEGVRVGRKLKDHQKMTGIGPRSLISKGVIAKRNPIYHVSARAGLAPGTISRDGIFKMNETQVQHGVYNDEQKEIEMVCSSSSSDDEQFGDRGVYNDEQKEIENAAIVIGKTLTKVLTSFKPVSESWTIYKVPKKLKDAYRGTSFEPKLVNIGFFNLSMNYRFKDINTHKWRFFSRFLSSMNMLELKPQSQQNNSSSSKSTAATTSTVAVAANHSKKIECIYAALKKLEASTRACYSEHVQMLSSENFIQMMMIDGCFIIELLRLCENLGKENIVDPLFSSRLTIPYLRHDLLILENQLPFPVLEKLFKISSAGNVNQHQPPLKYLILKFFDPLLPREKKVLDLVLTVVKDQKPHHLLDFFRSSFRSQQETGSTHINVSPSTSNDDQDRQVLINNVTRLKEAGIVFKKRETHNLLDIEFKNGNLYIPPLLIDENTCSVFLNFLVYEQCNQFLEPYFTNYLLFLDCLVDTSTDIQHLHSEGIIDHVLSSDGQVADLFNKLCKDVVHDLADNYLSTVLKEVNRYSGRKWNRWMAELKGTYFTNPWAFISFLAAVFLLMLTTIQTFFSVYAYYAPSS